MKILLFLSALVLAGCMGKPDPVEPIEINRVPLTRPSLLLPSVDRYNPKQVPWIIITPDNADEIFAELNDKGKAVVLFGLSAEGYENISINTAEALRIIMQQMAVIEGYATYYIEVDDIIYEYNISVANDK